jgi:hypothetical protein
MSWRHPTTWIPIAMSLAALATIGVHIAIAGTAPQPDEGAAAHIWQLLMAGQVPVVLFHAIRWFPQSPDRAAVTLAAQVAAGLAALAPVFLLGW